MSKTTNNKNLRRESLLVTAQTAYNLKKLAYMVGYGDNIGRVVDKFVREKMISLSESKDKKPL